MHPGWRRGERRDVLNALGLRLKKRFGDEGTAFFAEVEKVDKLDMLNAILNTLIENDSSLDELRALLK